MWASSKAVGTNAKIVPTVEPSIAQKNEAFSSHLPNRVRVHLLVENAEILPDASVDCRKGKKPPSDQLNVPGHAVLQVEARTNEMDGKLPSTNNFSRAKITTWLSSKASRRSLSFL